jgi:RNA polymerase sigma-70 factor (ECF subfamily)
MPDDWTNAFESHRDRLLTLAYRMLGQVQAAEDAVQDAYLRWRSVEPETVGDPGAYLTTIVTRLCLDEMSSARAKRETYTGPWLPEPSVAPLGRRGESGSGQRPDHAVEQADAVSFALLVMLETLPPRQRAAYVLREALDRPYAQIAGIIGESEAYCRKLAQRAREQVDETDVETNVSMGTQAELVEDFVTAIEEGDAEAIARTLAEEAVVKSDGGGKVTAARRPIEGREQITRFLLGVAEQAPDDLEARLISVNGRPGLLATIGRVPQSVWAFHLRDGRIQNAYAVLNPDKLCHLDLSVLEDSEKWQ